jgi:glycosyltransferase involved in cell wall biosynthesis
MNKNLVYLVSEDWYFLSHRLSLAKEAQNKGYNVHVVCKDTGMINKIKDFGFKCYELNSSRNNTSLLNLVKEILNIRIILKRINPAIVHLVAFRPILLGLSSLIFFKNVKIVTSITGLGSIFLSKNIKVKFLKIIIILFLSINFKRKNVNIIVQNIDDYKFCIKSLHCSKDKIFIIRGSGVDTEYFKYENEPSSPPITITFVGRLIKDKGIEVLFDAFHLVSMTHKNINLLIAGSIDLSNPSAIDAIYIKRELSKNKNITWLGEVSDIKQLWKKSHIAILPSRREGLPKSLLEAAASGKAIIATDVPGCREIAINNFNAITVPPDNVIKLAKAIEHLSKNHKIRKKYGLKSRELVEKDMSEEFIINKTIFIYENLYKSLIITS